jgi:hypothetical protein
VRKRECQRIKKKADALKQKELDDVVVALRNRKVAPLTDIFVLK